MTNLTPDLSAKLDAAIVGESLDAVIPMLAAYLANCGVHGNVPRSTLKEYISGVIDDLYDSFTAPTNKDHIQ